MHELLVNWEDLVYTDGSVQTGGTGARTGSGVYVPNYQSKGELEVMLDPAGAGMTNTINRAELAPILPMRCSRAWGIP